jgi:TPR repeat protein
MHVIARNPRPPGQVPPETPPAPATQGIPQGFVPLEAMKALPTMGRWPPLPDGLPGWLPFQALVEMARREQAGDDAARHWLEVYRHAVQGDTAAQRRMGGACESGSAGIGADLPRAFFWYYRAGLAGDTAASERALRLKDKHEIPPAAMQEPALVYPGLWRMRREDGDGATQRVTLELHDDQRLAGLGVNGLWSFDAARRVLTLAHQQTWRVRIVACRESLLFGRDAGGVPCTLERAGPLGAREEVSRRP